MAKGNKIIVSEAAKGVRLEGWVTGTPKPGTVMEIDVSETPVNGDFYWEPFGVTAASGTKGVGADGDRRLIAVLLEKSGEANTTAYVTGDRCELYVPAAGELINMLFEDVSGTADDHAIGDTMIVDDGTGKLIATTGDPESEPFMCLETGSLNALADQLLLCMATGQ